QASPILGVHLHWYFPNLGAVYRAPYWKTKLHAPWWPNCVTRTTAGIGPSVPMDLIQSRAMFCRWRNNIQTVSQTDSTTIYFSMDGGTSYKRPSACTLSVVTNTTDMVDVSFKQTYSSQVHAE